MKLSILPIFVALVFVFCLAITRRARSDESIKSAEARSVYLLLLTFLVHGLRNSAGDFGSLSSLLEDPTFSLPVPVVLSG